MRVLSASFFLLVHFISPRSYIMDQCTKFSNFDKELGDHFSFSAQRLMIKVTFILLENDGPWRSG